MKSNAIDKVEISGHLLCDELELNPKVLHFAGVITTFGEDAMVNWITFVKMIAIFLLRKNIVALRLEFLMSFLNIKSKGPECLTNHRYIEERLLNFRFSKRKNISPSVNVQAFWDQVRLILHNNQEVIFDQSKKDQIEARAVEYLKLEGVEAQDSLELFDLLFEIA